MAFWPIKVTCPRCGSPEMSMLAPPARRTNTLALSAVWECVDCGSEYLVGVAMSCTAARARHAARTPPVCGTERGYQRHRYVNTPPCDPCKQAHSRHNRAGAA